MRRLTRRFNAKAPARSQKRSIQTAGCRLARKNKTSRKRINLPAASRDLLPPPPPLDSSLRISINGSEEPSREPAMRIYVEKLRPVEIIEILRYGGNLRARRDFYLSPRRARRASSGRSGNSVAAASS